MIRCINVSKRYRMAQGNSRWVLRDVNLAIPPLRSVGVIGANGAGKSTLLRLLGGMDSATSGEVVRTSRVSWPLGLGGGLQGSLTGRQNAKFVCRLHGQEQAMQSVLSEISAFSELGPSFDEPVRTYSSGMQARLKFAMSLAFRFDVYLVDELTAVGDAAFKRKSRQAFQRLASESSVIMVSHDERTLKEFCVSGILVQEGSAVWFDNLDDALAHYKGATAK